MLRGRPVCRAGTGADAYARYSRRCAFGAGGGRDSTISSLPARGAPSAGGESPHSPRGRPVSAGGSSRRKSGLSPADSGASLSDGGAPPAGYGASPSECGMPPIECGASLSDCGAPAAASGRCPSDREPPLAAPRQPHSAGGAPPGNTRRSARATGRPPVERRQRPSGSRSRGSGCDGALSGHDQSVLGLAVRPRGGGLDARHGSMGWAPVGQRLAGLPLSA